MEIAVNIKPIQFPTDPLNEVFAAVVQASSKEMAARVPFITCYYRELHLKHEAK
jgi:hypothetical protein